MWVGVQKKEIAKDSEPHIFIFSCLRNTYVYIVTVEYEDWKRSRKQTVAVHTPIGIHPNRRATTMPWSTTSLTIASSFPPTTECSLPVRVNVVAKKHSGGGGLGVIRKIPEEGKWIVSYLVVVVWRSLIILSTRGKLGNKFQRKANIIIFARIVLNQVQKKMELTRQLQARWCSRMRVDGKELKCGKQAAGK